VKSRNLSVA